MKSESIGKLAEALSKAQLQMESAKKDSVNPFFKNKYADLASVIEAIREPLAKNGLSYTQYCEEENEKHYVVTTLMHSSGEWMSGRLKLILTKNDMQALGGAITYARRYSLSAMVGITQDDDDGNIASGKPSKPPVLRVAPGQLNVLYGLRDNKEATSIITKFLKDHNTIITDLTMDQYVDLLKILNPIIEKEHQNVHS